MTSTISMQSAKLLLTLTLPQGSARSSLLDPYFLLLSPRRMYSPPSNMSYSSTFSSSTSYSLHLSRYVTHHHPQTHRQSFSLMSYSSHCIVQLPAVCHSCANHITKLAIMLVTSFSPLYPPRPTRYRPRHWHPY